MCAVISSILWVFSYIQYAFTQWFAESIAFTLRKEYLKSLMRQETAFFEGRQVEALPSEIQQYFTQVVMGFGEKFGQMIFSCGGMVGGIAIAFYKGPAFAAIGFCFFPIFMIVMGGFGSVVKKATTAKLDQLKVLGG